MRAVALLALAAAVAPLAGALYCDVVRDCGAAADNRTDDAAAITACAARCAGRSGGTVYIPAGAALAVTSVDLSNTTGLTLAFGEGAGLYAIPTPALYPLVPFLPPMGNTTAWRSIIWGRYMEDLLITGPPTATVYGAGEFWWPLRPTQTSQPPKLVEFADGRNITFEGVHYRDSPMWHLHPIFCTDVTFRGVTVTTSRVQGGVDGIDPESCANVLIDNCTIDVGDDGVSVKSGYHDVTGELVPATNITVRNSRIWSRNFAIGSACFGNITHVTVEDSVIGDARGSSPWAIKIKSHVPTGGVVANLTFQRLRLGAIAPNAYQQPGGGMALSVYQDYGHPKANSEGGDWDAQLAAGQLAWAAERKLPPPAATLIADIAFVNITGLSAVWAANPINGSAVSNITRLTFDNVDFGAVSPPHGQPAWLCDGVVDTTVRGAVTPKPPAACGV